MKKVLPVILILFSFLIFVAPAEAVDIPNSYKLLSPQTTTDINKVWTVKFSAPIDSSTVDDRNIYVIDDNNSVISTDLTLSQDETSVQVDPTNPYEAGKEYWLLVSDGIAARGGQVHLTQPVAFPFEVTATNSTICAITDIYSSLFTNFTIETTPDVFSVKVNQEPMRYEGNGTFEGGIASLAPGTVVTVSAYDDNGRLLKYENYTIR